MDDKNVDKIWLMPHIRITSSPVVEGDFEWDAAKAEANLRKHGVAFTEAATVFADPLSLCLDDGADIGRLVVLGRSLRDRLLYVVHVQRNRRDRIISARRATAVEQHLYENGDLS